MDGTDPESSLEPTRKMNSLVTYVRSFKALPIFQFVPAVLALILIAVFWIPATGTSQQDLPSEPLVRDQHAVDARTAVDIERNDRGGLELILRMDTLLAQVPSTAAADVAADIAQEGAVSLAGSEQPLTKPDSAHMEMTTEGADSSEPRQMNGVPPGIVRSTAKGIGALAELTSGSTDRIGSTRFFGLTAQNTHTVAYVIDCSGSMGKPPMKLLLAKQELIRSIQALQAEQSFYVVFFSHQMYPMPGPGVLPATDANKERVCGWIEGAVASGGTNPLPAVLSALEFQPETIYVLSDGLFKGDYIRAIGNRNREPRRTSIYTINFGDRHGERQLVRLARENGGHYRYFMTGQSE
jgi:hypothetical protein